VNEEASIIGHICYSFVSWCDLFQSNRLLVWSFREKFKKPCGGVSGQVVTINSLEGISKELLVKEILRRAEE